MSKVPQGEHEAIIGKIEIGPHKFRNTQLELTVHCKVGDEWCFMHATLADTADGEEFGNEPSKQVKFGRAMLANVLHQAGKAKIEVSHNGEYENVAFARPPKWEGNGSGGTAAQATTGAPAPSDSIPF